MATEVSVEDLGKVPQVKLGSKGILIRIREKSNAPPKAGKNIGKLWIGKAKVQWARGSVPKKNAKSLSMTRFVKLLNNLP
jgi:hypothetical protein